MLKAIKNQLFRNIIAITACVCGVIVLTVASNAHAAKPGGFSCLIEQPADGTSFPAGSAVDFQGRMSSGTKPYAIHWDFGDGNTFDESGGGGGPNYTSTHTNTYPSPAADTPYTVTLDATDNNGATCAQQSITITIQGTGGNQCTRNAPTFSLGADQAIDANGSAVYTLSVTNNDTAACANTTFSIANADTGDTGSFNPSSLSASSVTVAPGATDTTVTLTVTGNGTGAGGDALTSTTTVSDDTDHNGQDQNDSVTTTIADNTPIARGDTYATPANGNAGTKGLNVTASRVSGVLYNDFGGEPPLTAQLVSGPANAASFNLNADGSFNYTPNGTLVDNDNDSFTYIAVDSLGVESDPATVNINILSDQPDFKIMMNYELGMHCTGFEFAYCCVLPPYNSIVAQVVKPQATPNPDSGDDYPRLLEGSHHVGTDGLGRPTVVQAGALDGNGDYQTYMLEYFHDAQPRNEGQGKVQSLAYPDTIPSGYEGHEGTLISAVEGNSLFYQQTIYDSAQVLADGSLKMESYEGADDVVVGDGSYTTPCTTPGLPNGCTDNYANGWLNHFYIYADLEGTISGLCEQPVANVDNKCVTDQNCNTTGICDATDPGTDGNACTGDSDCGQGLCVGFIDDGACDRTFVSSREEDKIRLGVAGHIEYPADSGAALHPMGPTGNGAFDNLLTFSGDTGTVVYTQMKVLENLPVMLTSPDIWEALGLPLTTLEDSIGFFLPGGPGSIDEDSVRPYVAMKAKLYEANCDQDPLSETYGECTQGNAVLASNGQPVIGHGTAPIDIPNCERCHSVPPTDGQGNPNTNSPSYIRSNFTFQGAGNGLDPNDPDPDVAKLAVNTGDSLAAITEAEYQFWLAYYDIVPTSGDYDWYARLKGAAINMLALHDFDQNTGFTAKWPANDDTNPATNPVAQNTRLGKESVICQKCHADNVIAVVKSATKGGNTIKPISEAIHWRHREINEYSLGGDPTEVGSIDFADAAGRSGGCQGCHPAHRSDGVMDGYPITRTGDNAQANSDNRLAAGGCFVGRDVHSNVMKDSDGVETPAHLNAVGQYLADNVFYNQNDEANEPGHDTRGIWCTNCHTQLGQEMWKAEDCIDLIAGDCVNNVRGLGSLDLIATAIGSDPLTVKSWLDPKSNLNGNTTLDGIDHTHRIWDASVPDANVAIVEVAATGNCVPPDYQPWLDPTFNVDVCAHVDDDGDPSYRILDFCTTDSCVTAAQGVLDTEGTCSAGAHQGEACIVGSEGDTFCGGELDSCAGNGNVAVAVPFSAATDGRDHWLAGGEPHCADCHAAPFVEPSGNHAPYPPFNYPRKASLMRYSRGHQNISCQGCHESIHGLYPVTPAIDTTSYAQAAALNPDGSHGPLKCGACHEVGSNGVPKWMRGVTYNGSRIRTFDDAVAWAHTFTRNDSVLTGDGVCTNCHAYPKGTAMIEENNGGFLAHSYLGRVGRKVQDQAEIEALGHVAGDPDTNGDGEPDRTPVQIAGAMCVFCHAERGGPSDPPDVLVSRIACNDTIWKSHVFDGRLSEKVWEFMTESETGSTCGW